MAKGDEPAALRQVFALDRIEKLCGVRAFARASMIFADEIEDLAEDDRRLSATVRGTMPYAVALWVEGTRKAAYSCTCPQGEDGKFCKHAGAVALTLHGGGRRAVWSRERAPTDADVESDPVFEYLLGLDHRELAHLVYDSAIRDPRTAQRIEAKVAVSQGRPSVDTKEWRKAVTAAFGRPSHFVDYREAPRWAERVNDVLDDLRGLLEDGEAESIIPLVEYAFERADKATQYVDSSDGWFGGISFDIADIHLRACRQERPDPVALARRLAAFDVQAELDTFRRAALAYADVLGASGIAEYRRVIEPAFDALPLRSESSWSTERFHLTEAMLGIALATDDADEVIRIKSADLRSPMDYTEIVSALRAVDRLDEAIEWARRGLALPGREFQKHDLRAQLVEVLRETGDMDGAKAEHLDSFHASPSLRTYKDLLAETTDDDRSAQRAEALDWLCERAIGSDGPAAGSVLVEIHLHEGDLDAAWDAATMVGCDPRWWMTLARAREKDHPTDSLPIYEQAINDLIDRKTSGAYKDAVALMARVERLRTAVGDAEGWRSYLAEVTTRHVRKSSLMTRIRDKGWL